MKVLHGMSDVAGQGSYSVKALRENHVDAKIAVWRRNPFGYQVDIDIGIGNKKYLYPLYLLKMIRFAVSSAHKYDVFHFHYGHSLLPDALDLRFLKLMHKKVFMEFHGSDVRWSVYRKKPEFYYADSLESFGRTRKKKNDRIVKLVDGVIIHDEELRKHIPGSPDIYVIPLKIDITKFEPFYPDPQNSVPVIVHAPSNYIVKGSKYILEAVERLKKKYSFEFILVEHKTQQEALEIYKKADIVIDQLFAGTYGVFSVEAMAMGKPVIAYLSQESQDTFPTELPIVSADINHVETAIERLLKDGELRNRLGVLGRQYAENYHDSRKTAKVQQDLYLGKYAPVPTREAFEYTKEKEI